MSDKNVNLTASETATDFEVRSLEDFVAALSEFRSRDGNAQALLHQSSVTTLDWRAVENGGR